MSTTRNGDHGSQRRSRDQLMPDGAAEATVTLLVRHESLAQEPDGRLRNDAQVLVLAAKVGDHLLKEHGGPSRGSDVLSAPGSYQLDLHWLGSAQPHLPSISTWEQELAELLYKDCAALQKNAILQSPQARDALKISESRYGLLVALAELGGYGASVGLLRRATDELIMLPLPQLEHLGALPRENPAPRLVRGQITGVGVHDGVSSRVEVNRGAPMVVQGLALKDAVGKLGVCHVEGTRVKIEGVMYLRDAKYTEAPSAADLFDGNARSE